MIRSLRIPQVFESLSVHIGDATRAARKLRQLAQNIIGDSMAGQLHQPLLTKAASVP